MYAIHPYFRSNVDAAGGLYSVDKIALKGKLKYAFRDSIFDFLNGLNHELIFDGSLDVPFGYCLSDIKYYERHYSFAYRFNFLFSLRDFSLLDDTTDVSFYFGLAFNDASGERALDWKLEFNPNKVGNTDFFRSFYSRLYLMSNSRYFKLVEYDLAIDYSVPRDHFCMLRTGHRTYHLIRQSLVNVTEYLGTRHKNGFVKLYNKALESGVYGDLSRLEITLDTLNYENLEKQFPNVRIIPESFDFFQRDNTDFILFYAVLHDGDLINLFDRMQKKRFLEKLDAFVSPLVPNQVCFTYCVSYIVSLLRGECL